MVKKEFKTGIRQATGSTSMDTATRVRGLRNLVAVTACLAGMTMFLGCEKLPNNDNDDFPLGTNNWNSIACIAVL